MAIRLFADFDPDSATYATWRADLKAALKLIRRDEHETVYVLLDHRFVKAPGEKKAPQGPLLLVGLVAPGVVNALKKRIRGHVIEDGDGVLEFTFDKDEDKAIKAVRLLLRGKREAKLKDSIEGLKGKEAEAAGLGGTITKDWKRRARKVEEILEDLDVEIRALQDEHDGSPTHEAALAFAQWGLERLEESRLAQGRGHTDDAFAMLEATKKTLRRALEKVRKGALALERGKEPEGIGAPPRADGFADYARRRGKAVAAIDELEALLAPLQDDEEELDDRFQRALHALSGLHDLCGSGVRLADTEAERGEYEAAYATLETVKAQAKDALAQAAAVLAARESGGKAPKVKTPEHLRHGNHIFDASLEEFREALAALNEVLEAIEEIDPDERTLASLTQDSTRHDEVLATLVELGTIGNWELAWDAMKDAKRDLDATLADARRIKKRHYRLIPLQLENSPVELVGAILPGVEHLSEEERSELIAQVDVKIAAGKAIYALLAAGDFDEVEPTRKNIADLMWYLRVMSEQKAGEPWERGAMTIPDDGKAIRQWLDGGEELYNRGSSHMRDQQEGIGNTGRGIDFYEGVDEHDGRVIDPDLMLPYGMRTILIQSMDTSDGHQRLYLKMETESARLGAITPIVAIGGVRALKKGEVLPEARPLRWEDISRGIKHANNLSVDPSDKGGSDLAGFKENVPEPILSAYTELRKAAKRAGTPWVEVFRILDTGKWKGGIHQMHTNLQALTAFEEIPQSTLAPLVRVMELLQQFGDLSARVGDEVVMTDEDFA